MKTTFRGNIPADYLGVDLTDRYAKNSRSIDVCGLTFVGPNSLNAAFWHWQWASPQESLDVSTIAREVKAAKSTMLDGPQGLATIGETMRACERQCGAMGKTPDTMQVLGGKPLAGYIRSSLELFSAFAKTGFSISPPGFIGGVSEVYPGNIWNRLTIRVLPKKSAKEGRLARKLILQALGVTHLPDLPTHDENDACISAVLAAAADSKVTGVAVRGIGLPLEIDSKGTLREGPMVIPELSEGVQQKIEESLSEMSVVIVSKICGSRQSAFDETSMARAITLRDDFIEHARKGNAKVCTYACAYRHLFDSSYSKWSQAYAKKVVSVAKETPLAELPGLGAVRLDAFIVASRTGVPGNGHWESANYEREDWERVLGTAKLCECHKLRTRRFT